ncbi:glycine betaine ABC transporter substrate-binding protein [Virgibacillus sp. YIM 98842]|uniref:ABC transporter substrate-binding protein n=1 Tax=Virgibacillus sp. YIM 98842 TaxID=2663533 RepID=UPI0013DB8561|nr:glycine betaine ABC transporter substrate-binding protein [Virgibacillus sp. YIM 98842]
MKKRIISLITVLLIAATLTACGGSDDGESKEITFGAKNFTEQFLLAQMGTIILEENGFNVEERSNLGSTALRQALENEQVDITFDYTGTGLVTYMGEEPIADKQEAYETVNELDQERNGIYWTNLMEVNNTYTIAMKEDRAEELGIVSIADLADYVNENPGELRFGTDAEFGNRDDGLPGVEETYGFEFGSDNISEMSYGLQYDALENDEVDVAMGFETDSRIRELNLVNLEDPEEFFPSYNAALSMTENTYENYPEIRELLQPLTDELDSEIMRELNYQVDIEERSVNDVAREYLEENGFLE